MTLLFNTNTLSRDVMQFIFGDKREATWLIRECPTCDWKKGEERGEYEQGS